jgi:hypothetical protein
VSLHFDLHVDLALANDLTDPELAAVRWLFGLGPRSGAVPSAVTSPLVSPQADVEAPRVPGGAHARLAGGPGAWSVSGHDMLLDDHFYEGGLVALQWLASVSAVQGLYATAREELSLLPGWLLFSFDGHAYLLHEGRLRGMSDDAPPPPEWATAALAGGPPPGN